MVELGKILAAAAKSCNSFETPTKLHHETSGCFSWRQQNDRNCWNATTSKNVAPNLLKRSVYITSYLHSYRANCLVPFYGMLCPWILFWIFNALYPVFRFVPSKATPTALCATKILSELRFERTISQMRGSVSVVCSNRAVAANVFQRKENLRMLLIATSWCKLMAGVNSPLDMFLPESGGIPSCG